MNALRAAWRRWLDRHVPLDPPHAGPSRLDVLDGLPTRWTPVGDPLPAARDPWADDPDRTTRRDTYR